MPEITDTAPAAPPPPRRLHRSRGDRVVGGVAGGLGSYFDVDPILFRLAFGVLAIVGGAGVLAYLAALAFVPEEGDAPRRLDSRQALTYAGVGLLALVTLAVLGEQGGELGPLLVLAVLAGIGYAVFKALRRGRSEGGVTVGRLAAWVATGAAIVAGALVLAVGAALVAADGSGALVAAVVIAIGVLLVAAALLGRRARWLAVPALVIAGPLGIVSAADVSFDGGFGERQYRPASVSALPAGGYRLGAGELRIDLRDLDLPAGSVTDLPVRLGAGHVEIVVPRGVCATTDSRLGAGYFGLRGREAAGLDVDYLVRSRPARAPQIRIRADVGLGAVEVLDRPRSGYRRGPGRFDRPLVTGASDQGGACRGVEIASAG